MMNVGGDFVREDGCHQRVTCLKSPKRGKRYGLSTRDSKLTMMNVGGDSVREDDCHQRVHLLKEPQKGEKIRFVHERQQVDHDECWLRFRPGR